MSGRLADVTARIGTVEKLSAVISAMRGIAASRAQEAERHLESIRLYSATIGDAIGHALSFLPEADRPAAGAVAPGRQAVVVLAAEQGFAGAFSERVFDAAAGLGTGPGDLLVVGDRDLLVVGDRGLPVAEERGLAVVWSAPMIAHTAQASALATRITEAVFERVAQGGASRVALVHGLPGPGGATEVAVHSLVPFDYSRFPPPPSGQSPRITLPPDRLLARLVEEYVFAEVIEAVMLSFAAENAARMRAMIAAHDNVSETLGDLVARSRRLRQEEITDEIVEIASSA